MTTIIETFFAPAERSDDSAVLHDRDLVHSHEMLQPIIDAMPHSVALLNEHRQVITANETMVEQLGDGDVERVLGLRPGELIQCAHAARAPGGCGTTEACRTCGAVAAVLAAQSGRTVIRDCSIGITDATAADLRIKASPFGVGGRNFTLIAIQDIADQKRREVLERAFFHDILNVAGGIQGIAILLEATESTAELQEYVPMLTFTTEQLVEEIKCQRDLVAAESGDLDTITSRTNSLQILREVTETYRHDAEGAGHSVVIDPDSSETGLEVSHVLLVRVLGNMIRNALEASTGEAGIRTGCRRDEDHIEFWVWNDDVMAQEVQMQIFRRSFSTKGVGRGIGTYSMKLLTERYLGGEISFVSAAGRGTEFRLRLPLGPPAS